MTAYCDNKMDTQCLQLYNKLCNSKSINPTTVTYLIAIKACGNIGDIKKAKIVFDCISNKTIESINCMMRAYLYNGLFSETLSLYEQFNLQNGKNDVSKILALKACTNSSNSLKGMEIINSIENMSKDICVELKCTLIDFYGNCGNIDKAFEIFESIAENKRDIICINTMMTVYFENGLNVQCIELFKKYYEQVLKSDIISHIILFKACSLSSAYHFGKKIHNILQDTNDYNFMLNDRSIQINLIHMYGKCGMVNVCQQIFDEIKETQYDKYCNDIDIWNAIIHAYGRNGDLNTVKELYDTMTNNIGINADDKIFTSLINACSHCGDVYMAQNLWENEIKYEKKYSMNTINALVDCFARNGYLKEAYDVIKEIDNYNELLLPYSVWMCLLNGCRKYRNKEIAENVFNEMKERFDGIKYKNKLGAASIILSHIYASYDEFDKVDMIRKDMKQKGWTKMKGISEIDINGTLYRFEAGNKYKKDFNKLQYELIDNKLLELSMKLKQYGFKHDFSFITKELTNDLEKEYELLRHSEKLALVYGLLNTTNDYQIVINKNLRICNDCHEA
eukprot:301317_1